MYMYFPLLDINVECICTITPKHIPVCENLLFNKPDSPHLIFTANKARETGIDSHLPES